MTVIAMESVSRKDLPSSYEEVLLKGFMKALKAIRALRDCTMRERLIALENWEAAGMLSAREVDELVAFYRAEEMV